MKFLKNQEILTRVILRMHILRISKEIWQISQLSPGNLRKNWPETGTLLFFCGWYYAHSVISSAACAAKQLDDAAASFGIAGGLEGGQVSKRQLHRSRTICYKAFSYWNDSRWFTFFREFVLNAELSNTPGNALQNTLCTLRQPPPISDSEFHSTFSKFDVDENNS